jgi:2-methylisocitrate lyase-like PEP mutase family enzyme
VTPSEQAERAHTLRALHSGPRILILPNIWDPMGARLLERLGYPAVATASAAVAYSRGVDDGEKLPLETVLRILGDITAAVTVPVTVDLEAGYGRTPADVAETVRRALEGGIAGLNLEDTNPGDGTLFSVGEQIARIRAVRSAADARRIPLVVNARTDVFLHEGPDPTPDKIREAVTRARAYLHAGADCIYPILLNDLETLRAFRADVGAPVNVYATAGTPSIADLQAAGINRLSLGPGLLKASLTTMKRVAEGLLLGGSYEAFTEGVVTNDEIRKYILGG